MRTPYGNWYDRNKDRWYGWFFLVLFLAVVVLWVFARKLDVNPAWFWVPSGIVAAVALGRLIRDWRGDRRTRWTRQPLSSDEIRKARSKLTRCRG